MLVGRSGVAVVWRPVAAAWHCTFTVHGMHSSMAVDEKGGRQEVGSAIARHSVAA